MSERPSSLEAYASVASRLEKIKSFSNEFFVAKGDERLNRIATSSNLPSDPIERMVRIGLSGATVAMQTEGYQHLTEKTTLRLKREQALLRENIEREITEKSITAEGIRTSIRQTNQNLQDIESAFGADSGLVLQLKHMIADAQQELESLENEMDALYAALTAHQTSEKKAGEQDRIEEKPEVDPSEAFTAPQQVEPNAIESSVQQRPEVDSRGSLETQMISYITNELQGQQDFYRTYAQVEQLYQQFRGSAKDSRKSKDIRNSVMVMISNVKKMLQAEGIEIKSKKDGVKTVGYIFSRSNEPSVVATDENTVEAEEKEPKAVSTSPTPEALIQGQVDQNDLTEKAVLGDVTEQNLVDFVSILFQYKTDLLSLVPNSDDAPSIDALVDSFNPPEMRLGNGSLLDRRKVAVRSLLDLIKNQPDLVYAAIGSASSTELVANASMLASEIEDALSSTVTMSAEDWNKYESRLMKFISHHAKGTWVISENCLVIGSQQLEEAGAPEPLAPEARITHQEIEVTESADDPESIEPEEATEELADSPDESAPVSIEKPEKKRSKVDQFIHDLDSNVQSIVDDLREKGLAPSGDNPNPFFHVSHISKQIGWVQPFLDNESNRSRLNKQIKDWINLETAKAPEISYYALVYLLLEKTYPQITEWKTSAKNKIVNALFQVLGSKS